MNKYLILEFVFFSCLVGLFFTSPVSSYDFSNHKNVNGSFKVIVIPVEFNDKVASTNVSNLSKQVFESMNHYFQNVSYDKISITGEVYDSWVTLPYDMPYYGDYNGQNDHSAGNWRLIRHSVSEIDQSVDFSPFDFIIIVHSGEDEAISENTTDIWSWGWWEDLGVSTNDGRNFSQGAVVSEFDSVGTFCHEFGHILGLPDLYNIDENSSRIFVNGWGLMGSGNHNGDPQGSAPSHIMGWGKMFLGWLTPDQIVEINVDQTENYTISPLEKKDNGTKLVKILTVTSDYFLIEVRKDENLPKSGVLITYVNETLESGKGIVKVIDSTSSSSSPLSDATLNVGGIYENITNKFSIRVLEQTKNKSFILQISNKFHIFTDVDFPEPIATNENFNLTINVSDFRGNPLNDVPITLSGSGQKTRTKISNTNGDAFFELKFDLFNDGNKPLEIRVDGGIDYYSIQETIEIQVDSSIEPIIIWVIVVLMIIGSLLFLKFLIRQFLESNGFLHGTKT
jgi:M6 family metalloprotease-like protein